MNVYFKCFGIRIRLGSLTSKPKTKIWNRVYLERDVSKHGETTWGSDREGREGNAACIDKPVTAADTWSSVPLETSKRAHKEVSELGSLFSNSPLPLVNGHSQN